MATKKLVIRGQLGLTGTLESGTGDAMLTRDAGSFQVGSVPAVDTTNFLTTTLASGKILVGSNLNIATARTLSGAITIDNVGISAITGGYITDGHISGVAGITRSKIAAGTANSLLINNGSGVLSDGPAISGTLTDPGANAILGWDDTDNSIGYWTLGSGLTYDHATHSIVGVVVNPAWLLASGGTLSGANTITGNLTNPLTFNGTYTTTANADYFARFIPTVTMRNVSAATAYGTQLGGSYIYTNTTQDFTTLRLSPTFDNTGAFASATGTVLDIQPTTTGSVSRYALRTSTASNLNVLIGGTAQNNARLMVVGSATTDQVLVVMNSSSVERFNFVGTGQLLQTTVAVGGSASVAAFASGSTTMATTGVATVGAQEMSPALIMRGSGWKTNATAGSQNVDFYQYVLPVQGAANPTPSWILASSINGAALVTQFQIAQSGTATIITAGNNNGATITSQSATSINIAAGGGNGNLQINSGGNTVANWSSNLFAVTGAITATTSATITVAAPAASLFRGTASGVPTIDLATFHAGSTITLRNTSAARYFSFLNGDTVTTGNTNQLVYGSAISTNFTSNHTGSVIYGFYFDPTIGGSQAPTEYSFYATRGDVYLNTTRGFGVVSNWITYNNNGNLISALTTVGAQLWNLYNTSGTYLGVISYTTPGGDIGIVINDPTNTVRYDIKNTSPTGGSSLNIYRANSATTFVRVGSATASTSGTLTVTGVGTSTATTFKTEDSGGVTKFLVRDDGNTQFGATSALSTATPLIVNLGGTFGNSVANGYKLKLYDDGTPANDYAWGISTSRMNFKVAASAGFSFYDTTNERFRILGSTAVTALIPLQVQVASPTISGIDVALTGTLSATIASITATGSATLAASAGSDTFSFRAVKAYTTGSTTQNIYGISLNDSVVVSNTGFTHRAAWINNSFSGAQVGAFTNIAYGHATGFVQWASVLSPSQITANQNNYDPAGWTNNGNPYGASIVRLDTDASRNITSWAGGVDGRIVIRANIGANPIVLKHDDGATGTAANRYKLVNAADITVPAGGAWMEFYDNTTARWRVITPSTVATGTVDNAILRSDGTGGSAVQTSTLYIDDSGSITNSAGLEYLTFVNRASAVNQFTITNSETLYSAGPQLSVTGSDTNIAMALIPKGTGAIFLNSSLNGGATGNVIIESTGFMSIATGAIFQGADRLLTLFHNDAVGNTVINMQRYKRQASVGWGVGAGIGIEYEVQTATSNNEIGAVVQVSLTDATAASEDFDMIFKTMVNGAAATEHLRFGSNKIGFLGATTVVKQTSGADLTNSVTVGGTNDTITDWSSLTVYATDAAAIRNAVYQLARKLKQVNDALRLYGLLT